MGQSHLKLEPIPLKKQKSVTFFEAYQTEEAFSQHVNGSVFQTFLTDFGHEFKQDPQSPGWPITQNGYYTQTSGFARDQMNGVNKN